MTDNTQSNTTGDNLDYLDQLRKLQGNYMATHKYTPPCPSCGYCPSCGRGGHQTYPSYPSYPNGFPNPTYPNPWVTYTAATPFLSGLSKVENTNDLK